MASMIKSLSMRLSKSPVENKDVESGTETGERPPPPKPGKNSVRIDAAFINTQVATELNDEQLAKFRSLMGEKSLEYELCMVNIGVALEVFEDYSTQRNKKKGLVESKEKYNWVFMTENPLGEQLSSIFANLENKRLLLREKQGASYRIPPDL